MQGGLSRLVMMMRPMPLEMCMDAARTMVVVVVIVEMGVDERRR